jgi:cell division protein FtsI (penicillin-binding protein 3)
MLSRWLTADRVDAAFEAGWRALVRRRAVVAVVLLGCWATVIEARLVHLQVVQHEDLANRATQQQQKVLKPAGPRGDIVDRNGRILAYSVNAVSIAADPSEISDGAAVAQQLCAAFDDCTRQERAELPGRLSAAKKTFIYVRRARSLSPAQAERVAALNLPGVMLLDESRRYYPNRDLAAHVLGYVGNDEKGLGGIERVYDEAVRGREGIVLVQRDARQDRLQTRVEKSPTPGARIELSIDLTLQHIAERELRAGVEKFRARGGTAIVMDPYTGEILALANYPTFNPNAYGRYPEDTWRNRATQEVYEPGSTFKIVTASAAIEEGVVAATDLIDCAPGFIKFPGRKPINDDHRYGVLTFEDVIVKSSNVGAIRVGLRTGTERLSRYVRRFGFGSTIAADFVGEARGQVYDELDDSALASVSMGYQISVTPVQMAAAVSAVANGGILMEPHVVRATLRDGLRQEVAPKALRRSIEPRTAAILTTMMEGVVERGTGRQAALDRHRVAGKTGTAKKLVDGQYSNTDYNASFVGFVPSRRPDLTILVVVDTPRGGKYYGGDIAAPIFKRIAEAAMQHRGVPPTMEAIPVVVAGATETLPDLPSPVRAAPEVLRISGVPTLPDVTGLGLREALAALASAGAVVRPSGSGVVVAQTPAAGTPLPFGSIVAIELRRVVPGSAAGPHR